MNTIGAGAPHRAPASYEEGPVYFLESPITDPHYNLALEGHLCQLTERMGEGGGPFFMLWRNAPSVIIGRFQDAQAEVNAAFVEACHIPVVRRNSGGGAVYHDLGNVNYSFILPEGREARSSAGTSPGERSPFSRERLNYHFAFFAGKVIRALARLGVTAEFSPGHNDILVGGRKISGMAQRRHNGVLLCHGTLLFDCDLDALTQALSVPEEKLHRHGVQSARGRVANLRPLLPDVADTGAFMALLWRALREEAPLFMEGAPFGLSARDEEAVRELVKRKYRNRAWNELGEERCDANAFFQR